MNQNRYHIWNMMGATTEQVFKYVVLRRVKISPKVLGELLI